MKHNLACARPFKSAPLEIVMTKSEPKQHFTLLSTLAANANLGQFTTEQIQVGISEPERAGQEFALFVANGFRVQAEDFFRDTNELTIQVPALPRPTLTELQSKFDWVKSIERDTSPTEALTLKLATVLRAEEKNLISGSEYERRIEPKKNLIVGYQHACWLVEHQDESPDLMKLLRNVYIDCPGLVVVSSDGHRHYPCLGHDGKRWDVDWRWISYGFGRRGRVGVSSK